MATTNGNGITAQQAIEATQGSKGFITHIAKRLGCSRRHVYNLMEKYATFKEAVEDERETLKDFAESKLFKLINDENLGAIIFYLKCQAKDRGYVERQELANAEDKPFTIKVVYDQRTNNSPTESS